ncbi:MAG: HAMP domain-containing sensor histidine kinase [Polyangiales bacterium]
MFGEPLDVSRRLLRVAQLVVPDMGDWCWIDVLEGGEVRRALTHHWNPALIGEMAVVSSRRHDANAPAGPSRVLETGEHELLVGLAAADQMDAPLTRFRSIIRVPLRDSERVSGVISLGFAESNREHTSVDLALVDALAIRAGWAVQAARQYEVATKAIAVREDILAVVAHDLRGPLGTIMLAADLLRPTEGSTVVDSIERAGARMERLIADLLDWASLESGHLRVAVAPVSVGAMLSDATDALAPQAEARELVFVSSGPDRDVDVACDRTRTFQVIANLVGNAIKFTPKDGRITLRAEIEPTVVRLTVEDEGPGIAPEHLAHIFERYWQAEPGTARRHGIGLGLAIARGIVTAQGGTISVESSPGRGARFSFTLPRA